MFANISIHASVQDTPRNAYKNILKLINMAVMECFTIYGAVLTAKIVISEYTERSALVMLTYPVEPKKWIIAKLCIVSFFVMAGTMCGNLLCTGFVVWRDSSRDIVQGVFSRGDLYQIAGLTVVSMIWNGFGILFPFAIGMIKKSVSATIVSAVFLVLIFQIMLTQTENIRELILSGIWLVLFFLIAFEVVCRKSIKSV